MEERPETWRPVVGHPGYEVSDHGRVRSIDRLARVRNGHHRLAKGRVLRAGVNKKTGYRAVQLKDDGKQCTRTVHSLVAEAFLGPKPEGMEVCHGAAGKLDNTPGNLRWDTRGENNRDVVRHRGEVCAHGHRFADENRRIVPGRPEGYSCLACYRASCRASTARRRHGVVLDIRALADEIYAELMAGAVQ